MAGRKQSGDQDAPRSTEPSWWVGLSREEFSAAVETHVFNTSKWRFVAPNVEEDPSYRNPFATVVQMNKHRKEAGFDMGTSFGGVVLVRDDPREQCYNDNPAPVEQTDAVRRMEVDRAYREWVANCLYSWSGAEQIYRAYDAAATLTILRRMGFEPQWSEEDRQRFEEWCAKHNVEVGQILELIE